MSTTQGSIDWYNKNARHYADHVRNPKDSIYHSLYEKPAMYALLPDLTGKAVLSLGCGSGEDSRYLKNRNVKKSVGIDLMMNSPSEVDETQLKELSIAITEEK